MALSFNPMCFQPGISPSFRSKSRGVFISSKPYKPTREVRVAKTHSLPPEKLELFKSIEGWVEENCLPYLKSVDKCWQPQDFLPDPASEGFVEEIRELRERTKELPDDYFVVLVGNMITEEALPTYLTVFNTHDGVRDETGGSLTPWAIWIRGWTAEENRHGDLLNRFLYLSGRVDIRQIEKTIQYLIGSGMDAQTENNPYLGCICTSFQERATFLSHRNTARLAKELSDSKLAQICGAIAADEKRHETVYTKIVEKIFEMDPDGAILALADMMKKKITMPTYLMYDGIDNNLFEHFSAVAQRIGVFGAKDYGENVEYFVERWNVGNLSGLSGEGRKAQEYVCGLPLRIKKLEERAQARVQSKKASSLVPFSWVFGKELRV